MESKKFFVIGCGRWGSFIAWYINKLGHNVCLYGRESSAKMQALLQTRTNEQLTLPESISLVTDIGGCLNSDVIIISIGSQQLESVAKQLSGLNIRDKTIVLCMKGIEISTGRRLSQVVSDTVDGSNRVAIWVGPGHVQDFYRGIPNCMVIDSDDDNTKNRLISLLSSDLIRFYYGTDLIGNEIGAAAKNVIGIAAGMLEGTNLSSLKGALMARGTREISNLISAMGGNAKSAYGLCLLGDFEATLFSSHSQNLTYGKCKVTNTPYQKLAEGYYTVVALKNLSEKYKVELPICSAVYSVLHEDKAPSDILDSLFSRSLKNEF